MNFQSYTATALIEIEYNVIDMDGNEGAPRELNIEITAASVDGETVTVETAATLLNNSRLERLIANSL